uniref:Uncharacterized protein AlNc14C1G46 n=1 Tax=Albugo laibachii Nc14 TaxID=890382 RepID=F0VYP4_9STRA|nr:conserved hypothetical protein [Albugo laibachii Nc14]|eukprot:CCA13908.1 conserved hypothetical protein [Albugo laibachii Nc14]
MAYNWADPKKNSRLNTMMMQKSERTRLDRLSRIKSTVSNQLHPVIEHKLLVKTKETVEEPQASDCESRRYSNDRSKYSREECSTVALLDIEVDAAADGLFHPESAVQAFSEHDAKFCVSTLTTGRNSRSDSHLPVLSGGKRSNIVEKGATIKSKQAIGILERSLASSRSETNVRIARKKSNHFESDLNRPNEHGNQENGTKTTNLGKVLVDPEIGSIVTAPARIQTCPHEIGRRESTHTSLKVPLLPLSQMSLVEKYQELKQIMRSNRSIRTQGGPSPECKPIASESVSKDRHDTSRRKAKIVPKIVTLKKSKQPVKNRNGVSLTDLREEHRQALEMLRELEGPNAVGACASDEKQIALRFGKETIKQTGSLPPKGIKSDSICEDEGNYENEAFEDWEG